MIIHTSSMFQIFFGDQRNSCVSAEHTNSLSLLSKKPFNSIAEEISTKQMFFLRQVHGTDGVAIDSDNDIQSIQSFAKEGDYSITNVKGLGLGIVTADCVPLVLYDKVHHAVAVIHAGWRGLISGVIERAVEHMNELFKTDTSQLQAFIGPCAKACCYTVGQEVILALDSSADKDRVLCSTQNGIHFNMPLFVQLQLRQLGIGLSACKTSYNECTICSDTLCSFRRDRTQDRNVTVVVLK